MDIMNTYKNNFKKSLSFTISCFSFEYTFKNRYNLYFFIDYIVFLTVRCFSCSLQL